MVAKFLMRSICGLALTTGLVAGAALAAGVTPTPTTNDPLPPFKHAAEVPKKHPDFSGMWLQEQGILFTDPTPKHHSGSHPGWDDNLNYPPFNDEYKKRYEAFKENVRQNGYDGTRNCDPPGMPRLMANPFPMEIIDTPTKVVMLFEYKSQIRRIYLDRDHPDPDDYDASFDGHSVGRWEGDTLVVDTTNIRNDNGKLIQITGIEHSDQLHIFEKFKLIEPDRLQYELTMIDPKVFTKPWTMVRSFKRKDIKKNVPEYVCLASKLVQEIQSGKKPTSK